MLLAWLQSEVAQLAKQETAMRFLSAPSLEVTLAVKEGSTLPHKSGSQLSGYR